MNEAQPFREWALVELMGHQRIVGQVSEQTLAGATFLRVDVPSTPTEAAFTRFYGAGAVYCLSPITEDLARRMASTDRNEPVSRYEIPQVTAGSAPEPAYKDHLDRINADLAAESNDDRAF